MADPEAGRNEPESSPAPQPEEVADQAEQQAQDEQRLEKDGERATPVNGNAVSENGPADQATEQPAVPDEAKNAEAKAPGIREATVEEPTQTSSPATPNGDRRPAPSREESNQSSDLPVRSSRTTSMTQTIDTGRRRTDSASTTATTATTRSAPRTSMVFVQTALETISNSKDARKRKPLSDAVGKALNLIKGQGDLMQTNPEIIFLPLQLATEASTISIVTTALDCIGKLISYSYFAVSSDPQGESQKSPLIERAIDTICDCFQGEATPNEVQMQIIKSLLSAILNDKIVVHGAGLLKAVRQIYNIFLLSKSSPNQQIAQGTLTQMVGTVFERVKVRLSSRAARFNSSKSSLNSGPFADSAMSPDTPLTAHPDNQDQPETNGEAESSIGDDETNRTDDGDDDDVENTKMTLQTFETRKSFDDARIADNAPTMVTRVRRARANTRSVSGPDIPAITIQGDGTETSEEDEEDEIYIKDAFLVFRAMCKLSTKALTVEDAVDIRSQGMRSKLLSLHIVHNVLYNHPIIFTSPHATIRSSNNNEPTTFTQAIKQYLCLSLSRNGSSSSNRVFEVSCEIFSLMVQHLRVMLKREIEVFLKEIYLAVLEKRSAPPFQKQYIIHIFTRLVKDAKALVEIYLNYDCDRAALDNMYQRIIEHISRLASSPVTATAEQEHQYFDTVNQHKGGPSDWQNKAVLPQSLSSATITTATDLDRGMPTDYVLKQESLECLVESLRSMVSWSQQGLAYAAARIANGDPRDSTDEVRGSIDNRDSASPLSLSAESGPPISSATPMAEDDPTELERVKQHKTALNNAVRQFNYKPKRGIKALIQGGFIPSDWPQDVAHFMLTNEKINKKALGEFLGEGDAENIAIMHAFVDEMDFTKTRFVDALRRFLQTFRLPGEAQKIDRLMLKFAERYTNGNPNAFANADTAYVLAYSVIMLNTDQHSSNVKKRMTPEDFIKNNRGINDNADLPDEYLKGIFEEIASNEIVLDTERETAANLGMLPQPTAGFAAGIGQALATVGRDLQREAYNQASEEMANKTEALFKNLLRAQKKGASKTLNSRFIPAQSFRHVGPMFEVTWMSYLTALSGQVQETNNLEAIKLCMEGLKLAVRIACLFDLQDPRQAFISSLTRFTNLYNLSEMKVKNIEALKTLLDTAYSEGNLLRESWRDVLTAISQLDRFQLISGGARENEVPDVMRRQGAQPAASTRRGQNARRVAGRTESGFQADVAEESRSADMIRSVDRIFTNTANLSGDAIVHFVRALTQVSWQEIQSSGQSESPRTYSLQKIVEVSGYNMTRVRFEWTNIWQVLGDHFVQVGCHNNTSVVYFALNSLRQLSMRFMEIEELPGFKFQKDFLKPFEHILSNANQVPVKDMVLRCLIQMIQARGDNIRSGWRTMFAIFAVAAKEPYEAIVNLAFDNVTQVYNDRFGIVISQGAFADLIVCLTEFSKNDKFQKKSLQAIETLKATVPKMLRTPECPLSQKLDTAKEQPTAEGVPKQPTRQTQEEQFWFPVLFAFHDVLMTGEDLEVRSRALNYLFDTLTRFGRDFPRDFWDILWRQLLCPIFMVLKSKSEMSKALNHEELSVWLSTTMIQALRNMISLFTHFFDSLEYMLDRFLDLLALCICQENDTLARIGSNCLQQLILQNVTRFTAAHWEKIVGAFVELFNRTEATALFSAATSSHYRKESTSSTNGATSPTSESAAAGSRRPSQAHIENGGAAELQLEPRVNGSAVGAEKSQADVSRAMPEPSRNSSVSTHPRPSTQHPPEADLESFHPESTTQQAPVVVTAARRRFFNQIITKCVLQLLMIETVSELFTNDAVYASIPSHELLRLMVLLKKSYHFAKRFNEDRELRTRLFREGFMRQPPNLLKQESGSASVYVSILLRMYNDDGEERKASRGETEKALIPLCADILSSYIELDEETQQRNIVTWRPVVVDVLEGYVAFGESEFERNLETFAPLAVGLMGKDMGPELQRAVQGLWAKVTEVKLGVKVPDTGRYLMTPVKAGFGRRGSRASGRS
ncbi:protein transport protein SEC7 [Elsinoe australis]|uniref:Protein transport protein SEC7 n=1 Tax=Elsinoe australis TaxID=40998 RepID=A0A4U7B3U9_9PEZI|nr:protein transport protein SEC7 [Elsinoe australis]